MPRRWAKPTTPTTLSAPFTALERCRHQARYWSLSSSTTLTTWTPHQSLLRCMPGSQSKGKARPTKTAFICQHYITSIPISVIAKGISAKLLLANSDLAAALFPRDCHIKHCPGENQTPGHVPLVQYHPHHLPQHWVTQLFSARPHVSLWGCGNLLMQQHLSTTCVVAVKALSCHSNLIT